MYNMNNFLSYHYVSFISGIVVGCSLIYLLNQTKINKLENKIDQLEKQNLNFADKLMYYGYTPYYSKNDNDY